MKTYTPLDIHESTWRTVAFAARTVCAWVVFWIVVLMSVPDPVARLCPGVIGVEQIVVRPPQSRDR